MAESRSTKGTSLKDELFNREGVIYLTQRLQSSNPDFDAGGFTSDVMAEMPALELKQRIRLISEALDRYLPKTYEHAVDHITAALPPPLDPSKSDGDFGRFIFAPFGDYVQRHGLREDRLSLSFNALGELTKRFSMEFYIRDFLKAFPEETFAQLMVWAKDDHYHLRRLVSEGSRPLLPWAGRLKLPINKVLPLLDQLHGDRTRYVTRSVANHLNDIAKSDGDLVVTTLQSWQKKGQQDANELDWMTRHALRTLVKQGHVAALEHLGFGQDPDIELRDFTLSHGDHRVEIGRALEFEVTIRARQKISLMVDYVIDFVKANGSTAPKTFKLKQIKLAAGDEVTVQKTHRFLADASTFTCYPGQHRLSLQINGQIRKTGSFALLEPSH